MSGSRCKVPWCKSNSTNSRFSFHLFPKEHERKESWCRNIGIDPAALKKRSSLCSQHFDNFQFSSHNRLRLKKDAVPYNTNPAVYSRSEVPRSCPTAATRRSGITTSGPAPAAVSTRGIAFPQEGSSTPLFRQILPAREKHTSSARLDHSQAETAQDIRVSLTYHPGLPLLPALPASQPTSVLPVSGSSGEVPVAVLKNILDWIRAQHGNTLPAEVLHLLPASCAGAVSGPSGSVTLSDLPFSPMIDEEPEDPLADSAPSSPLPLSPPASSSSVPATEIVDVDINRILSTQHDLTPHKCPHCQLEFESLHSLSQHAIIHCGIRLNRVQAFSSAAGARVSRRERRINRKRAMEAKANEKPPLNLKVKCRHCDLAFVAFSCNRYIQHLQLNPSHRDFRCPQCPMVYKQSTTLRMHIKDKHEGGLGMASLCPQCGKGFKRSTTLNRHVRVAHERADVFKCKYCQKEFYGRRNLEQHENIHLKRNRQMCPHCGVLQAPNNLKKHIEMVHEGKRLKCNFCGDLIKGTIRGHLILKHAEVSESVSIGEAVTHVYLDLAMIRRPGVRKPRVRNRTPSKRLQQHKNLPETDRDLNRDRRSNTRSLFSRSC